WNAEQHFDLWAAARSSAEDSDRRSGSGGAALQGGRMRAGSPLQGSLLGALSGGASSDARQGLELRLIYPRCRLRARCQSRRGPCRHQPSSGSAPLKSQKMWRRIPTFVSSPSPSITLTIEDPP